jgi:hypothetical protein
LDTALVASAIYAASVQSTERTNRLSVLFHVGLRRRAVAGQ